MQVHDLTQEQVLRLDPARHARVLGAPGTGKTETLVSAFARWHSEPGWDEGDVLVCAPNRLAATALRARIEHRVQHALGGTAVRTAPSFAFSVLARAAALRGDPAPRLLTGTVQDEVIAETVAAMLGGAGSADEDAGSTQAGVPEEFAGWLPEVLLSPPFRAELRELWRVLDDVALTPEQTIAEVTAGLTAARSERFSVAPDPELAARWLGGAKLISAVSSRLSHTRADELSASALLREAAAVIRADPEHSGVPKLVLIDDAQELGEGELAVIAACAAAGASVWVFGDPDVGTNAFHGERTEVLSRLTHALERRGADGSGSRLRTGVNSEPEQLVVLGTVHRHGQELRALVHGLTTRIGAAGAGAQRAATIGDLPADEGSDAPVQFTVTGSTAEQLGVIAHRLRARRLGVTDGRPHEWSDMAVLCRSRKEASRVARALAAHQVPTGVSAGGIVLREHQIVRELIRLVQHALGLAVCTAGEVMSIVGGALGGLDPVAIRRLRGALVLHERREARSEGRETRSIDELVSEAFADPAGAPVIDSPGGRSLRKIGLVAAAGSQVRAAGGTARETLWAIWDATKLAGPLQTTALSGRSSRADDAHRTLDAVLGLFFALQRHEEQDSEQPIAELLEELLASAVPEDTLAQRSQRAAVTVTTPQGAVGREFAIVAVVGLQDGAWPNLRARGSLLGTAALERWFRGGAAIPPSRSDTIHDELRLLAQACSRASAEVLVVAVSDEEQHPSPFFRFGAAYRVEGLPSARLTLRGATAQMRRRLTSRPEDRTALRALVALTEAEVSGAHPHDWYGVLPASTTAPLIDLTADPEATVPVSPSQLETAESCPLNWVIDRLGGSSGSVQADLGTLVHHALETAESADAEALLASVLSEWRKLDFAAEWESERMQQLAAGMTAGVAAYLREFEQSDRTLVGRESKFAIPLGRAVLRGMADRLEARTRADGEVEITVLDLKTGRRMPTKNEADVHAQMLAYQLGVELGAFSLDATRSGGARLLYVHPEATKAAGFVERVQEPITEEAKDALIERVRTIADVMVQSSFTARVEHHCSDPHQPGHCRLHIIPAVSHA